MESLVTDKQVKFGQNRPIIDVRLRGVRLTKASFLCLLYTRISVNLARQLEEPWRPRNITAICFPILFTLGK